MSHASMFDTNMQMFLAVVTTRDFSSSTLSFPTSSTLCIFKVIVGVTFVVVRYLPQERCKEENHDVLRNQMRLMRWVSNTWVQSPRVEPGNCDIRRKRTWK
jgi:hypothetical protein